MTLVLFLSFVLLLILNVPIAFSLMISSLVAVIYGGFPVVVVIQRAITATDSFILLAIPFFMIAGNLMDNGGISKRLISFANSSVGFIRGGLAHVNIVTSMLFAGITGAAVADTSAVGSILIPAMKSEKYSNSFSAAVTGSSSVIGVIIPPSIPFVIYGVITGVSVGRLFMAGFIPGILIGLSQMLISYVYAKKYNFGQVKHFSLRNFFADLKGSVLALLMPVIILGGIILGVVTPTEAAVLATIYALFIGFFAYGELSIKRMPGLLLESAKTAATVMFMIAGAYLYGWIITSDQIPQKVVALVTNFSSNPSVVLWIFVLIYFVTGMFIDLGASIILLVPVLFPVIQILGIDPLLFGVVTVMALAIGLVTPPVGACLFISCEIAGIPLAKGALAAIPFIIGMFLVLMLIIMFPQLALFIPRIVMG